MMLRLLKSLLSDYHPGIFFRYIPYNTIVYEMYDEMLDQITSRGGIVGVGFNHKKVFNDSEVEWSISRIIEPGPPGVVKLMNTCNGKSHQLRLVEWNVLLSAMAEVHDGFWLIGPKPALQTGYALPWDDTHELSPIASHAHRI